MPESIRAHAARIGARLLVAGEDYRVSRTAQGWALQGGGIDRRALPPPAMRGPVQMENAAGVLMALGCLSGRLPVDQQAVRTGLLSARLTGRFDVRPGRPTWLLDVAHNPQAAGVLNELLGEMFTPGRRVALCGMLADKDAAGIAERLASRFDTWHLVDLSDQPRGQSAAQLAGKLRPVLGDTPVEVGSSVAATMSRLAGTAGPDDLVVVFGSFLTVGAALAWLDRAAS